MSKLQKRLKTSDFFSLTPNSLRQTIASSGDLKVREGNFVLSSVLTGRSAVQARHSGKFFSEVRHSSHHHFTPTLSRSLSLCFSITTAVSQLQQLDLWTVRKKGLPAHAEMKKESSHILPITWTHRAEESVSVGSLH